MSVGHPRSTKEFNINIDIGLGALVVILAVLVRVMSLRRSTRSRTFAHTELRRRRPPEHRAVVRLPVPEAGRQDVRRMRLYPELAPADGRRRVIVPQPVTPPGRHARDAEAVTRQRPPTLSDNQTEPPRRNAWATMWHRHPAVSPVDELTVGERAADYMRNGMGSWAFVFGALLVLAVWITFNVIVVGAGHQAFDAYPFILLNLCLSCLAAMQGAILLIAAKRADQVSSELAAHDYEVNCRAEMLIEENTQLTRAIKELTEAIHHRLIDAAPAPAADHLLKSPTKTARPR